MGRSQLVLEKSQRILDFPTFLLGKADRGAQTEATRLCIVPRKKWGRY